MQCVSRSRGAMKFSIRGAVAGSRVRGVQPVRTYGSTRGGFCSTSMAAPVLIQCTLTSPRNFSMVSSTSTTTSSHTAAIDSSAEASRSDIVNGLFRTPPSDQTIKSLATIYLAVHGIVIGDTCRDKDSRFATMTELLARLSESMAACPHWPLLAVLADHRILEAVSQMRLKQFTSLCNAVLLRMLSDSAARSNEVFFINDALRMLSRSNAMHPTLLNAVLDNPKVLSDAISNEDFPIKSLLTFAEAIVVWQRPLPNDVSAAMLDKFAVWLTMQQSPGTSVDDVLSCVRYAEFCRLHHVDFLDALTDFLAGRLRHCCPTSKLLSPTYAQRYFALFAWCRRPSAHLFSTYAKRVSAKPEVISHSKSRSLHSWIMINWMFAAHATPPPPEAVERLTELIMMPGSDFRIPPALVMHSRQLLAAGELAPAVARKMANAVERAWERSVPGSLSRMYASLVPNAVAAVSCDGGGFVDVALLMGTAGCAPQAWSERALSPHRVAVADAMAGDSCVPVAVLLGLPDQFAACDGAPCGTVEDAACVLSRSGWLVVAVPVVKEYERNIVQVVQQAVEAKLVSRSHYQRFLQKQSCQLHGTV